MQRELERDFRNGILTPRSTLLEIKFIGDYLYRRLIREFARNHASLSIQRFATRIQNLNLQSLKERLQKALQNKRNNQCVSTYRGGPEYHVADVNEKGYEAMVALIRILAQNRDGYNLGAGFHFDGTRLRKPRRRDDDTKFVPCLSRRSCNRRNYAFRNGVCIPRSRSNGFIGVGRHTGQKITPHSRNLSRRGTYTQRSNGVSWRKPGRLRKI